jgi:aspartyl-tRNA(Asn)/glutamyl-tRNA(Gln) amidotransferase subunit A
VVGWETIHESTVCVINIPGHPCVFVPAGRNASGSPFCLIFVGPLWSEADLLGLAYDYEQATRHRAAPDLRA